MKTFIDWLVEYSNSDDLPFELSKEDLISQLKRIHENILSEGKKSWEGKHYGECTKKNGLCEFCMYTMWLDEYQKYAKEKFLS